MQRPAVLFACTLNRTRSPMAEGLTRKLFGPSVVVDSCGVDPAETFDPFMLAALQEIGAELPDRPGKGFQALDQGEFDLVVTLSESAQETARRLAAPRGLIVRHWPTADPTMVEGSRDAIMEAYREVREGLAARVRELFSGAIDLKRSSGV